MIELKSVSGEKESLAVIVEKDSLMEERIKNFSGSWWNKETHTWMVSLHYYQIFEKKFSRFGIEPSDKAFEIYEDFYQWRQDLLSLKNRVSLPNYKQHCKIPLEKYQPVAAAWLVMAQKGILADPVGTGKTYSVLEAFCLLHKFTGKSRAFIFSLSSNIYQWRDEINKAFPQIRPFVIDGDREKRKSIYNEYMLYSGLKALIINYEILIWDFKIINNIGKDVIIADELSKLKNKKSKIKAKIIDGKKHIPISGYTIKGTFIQFKCDYMWGISATPIENGLSDLFSVFNCIKKELFKGGWNRFANYFLELDYFNRPEGEKNIEDLVGVISPFLLNRPIELNLDIEAKDIFLGFDCIQKAAYDSTRKAINLEIRNNPEVSKAASLQKLIKLRQICNFPDIVLPDYTGESVKNQWTINQLKKIPKGDKTIIFSQWTETTDRISKALNENGIAHVVIQGGMSAKQKDKKLKFVEESENYDVILATDSISYGKNIQFCNWMIMYDLLWNPARITQRAGREARKGQLKKVHIFMLTIKGTVEEKLLNKIRGRINLFKKVLGLEWKVSLSKSELVQLLEEG